MTTYELQTWPSERLRHIFQGYADVDLPASDAWLYASLAGQIAADPEIMALAARVRVGQPPPNLLFAAVHRLLLAGTQHRLAEYYPDLTEAPLPRHEAYPHFRDFCLAHRDEISAIAQSRLVQTNVLERCGLLLPAMAVAAKSLGAPLGPLAVIEVGTSAGLNLLWDRYVYTYGDTTWGDAASPVRLAIDVRGDALLPQIPTGLRAAWSRGIDLELVNLLNDDALLWQRALMWPERLDRQRRLQAAIRLMATEAPRVVAGDACEIVPRVIAEAPADLPLCVLASFTLYQFPPEARTRLLDSIAAAGEQRPIALVTVDIKRIGDAFGTIELTMFQGAFRTESTLAHGHPHGAWIEWLAGP